MKASAIQATRSPLIGKTVTIRHATDTDLVLVEAMLKKNHYDFDDEEFKAYRFVVAVEDDDIIGAGGLKKTGDRINIGCVLVVEKRLNRGVAAALVNHLIEYSPVSTVYVAKDLADHFRELGYRETRGLPPELARLLGTECGMRGKGASVLMVYEK